MTVRGVFRKSQKSRIDKISLFRDISVCSGFVVVIQWGIYIEKNPELNETRMHSSGMHIACSSSHLGGGCLPQCMLGYTPLVVGLETPPGVGLETPWVWAWRPPGQTFQPPPGCGPGDPSGQTPQPLLSVGLETPRCEQNSWHTLLKILPCPKLRCGR